MCVGTLFYPPAANVSLSYFLLIPFPTLLITELHSPLISLLITVFFFSMSLFLFLIIIALPRRRVFADYLFAAFWMLDFLPACFNECFGVLFF